MGTLITQYRLTHHGLDRPGLWSTHVWKKKINFPVVWGKLTSDGDSVLCTSMHAKAIRKGKVVFLYCFWRPCRAVGQLIGTGGSGGRLFRIVHGMRGLSSRITESVLHWVPISIRIYLLPMVISTSKGSRIIFFLSCISFEISYRIESIEDHQRYHEAVSGPSK